MRTFAVFFLGASLVAGVPQEEPELFNPYERPKNGPPLDNVFHKARPEWILAKLRDPKHHPSARMPEFGLGEEEALDILAYLRSLAAPDFPRRKWPAWTSKRFDDLEEEEAFATIETGNRVWNGRGCMICHRVRVGGKLEGGYVDLRVGGIDLQIARAKLKRDWLYRWLRDPKEYFPHTLMPRFSFDERELRGLVEFILRDDRFGPESAVEDPRRWESLGNPRRISRGRRLVEISRCATCHDIKDAKISPLISTPPVRAPKPGSFAHAVWDRRCLSCHSIGGRGGTYAPDLSNEGSRLRAKWVERFVKKPDTIRPLLQAMPILGLSDAEAKTVAAHMAERRRDPRIPAEIPGGPVTAGEVERGRKLFRSKGCFACHKGEGAGRSFGPNLSEVGDRLRPGYLWFHLKNPHAVDPYSPEPDYGLTDEEARALSAFLSRKRR